MTSYRFFWHHQGEGLGCKHLSWEELPPQGCAGCYPFRDLSGFAIDPRAAGFWSSSCGQLCSGGSEQAANTVAPPAALHWIGTFPRL